VSGGLDSSYVTLKAVELGLRPILFHLDNEWDDPIGQQNIRNIVNSLDLDIHQWVVDWNEWSALQLSFLKSGTPNLEIPTDHAIVAAMYETAKKYKIKHIISGYNFSTESHLPSAWSNGHNDWVYIKGTHERFSGAPLSSIPHYSPTTYLIRSVLQPLKKIDLLNYVDYVISDVKETLKKEIGFTDYGPKHHESIYTRFVQGYILPKRFGYDKRKCHLSSLICSNQITRAEALELLEKPPYHTKKQVEDKRILIEKLRISEKMFDEFMALQKRAYWDYPHSDLISLTKNQSIRKIYRRLRNDHHILRSSNTTI